MDIWSRSATERRDLEPGVDEVERGRLELAREEVVLHENDVAEALRLHELSGGVEQGVVDVGPDHLSVGADPLAQQSQPADRAATEVDDARSTPLADLFEKATTARLPHARLELQPLQLGGLVRQEVRALLHDLY